MVTSVFPPPSEAAKSGHAFLTRVPLSRVHFNYLRALAQGVSRGDARSRYLGFGDADLDHETIVRYACAAARQQGFRHWKWLGREIRPEVEPKDSGGGQGRGAGRPSLEEFVETRGLEDFSEDEAVALYEEEFPTRPEQSRGNSDATVRPKNSKLIKLVLRGVDEVERLALADSRDHTPVSWWLDARTAMLLESAGMGTLGAVRHAVEKRKTWYRGIRGLGRSKAARVQRILDQVAKLKLEGEGRAVTAKQTFDQSRASQIVAEVDRMEAVSAWLAQCSQASVTRNSYLREVRRFFLWAGMEAKVFEGGETDDKLQENFATLAVDGQQGKLYREFLSAIPSGWISSRQAKPGDPAWRPFRGQISKSSIHQALTVLHGFFEHVVSYRAEGAANPFEGATEATRGGDLPDKKAFCLQAVRKANDRSDSADGLGPARSRLAAHLRTTGIPPRKLLQFGLQRIRSGSIVVVDENGMTTKTPGARKLIKAYAEARERAGEVFESGVKRPLLANVTDSNKTISYQVLYESLRGG